jgi:hypothetical protein
MATSDVAAQMRRAASVLLGTLDESQLARAALSFEDTAARRWLEYRPEWRPGACLAHLSQAGRKAAHRLLATALSEHAYAQAMVVIALEEVLDRREHWQRGRNSTDYWVSVFGDPAGADPWSWRFEGHHLSVTMTLDGDVVSPAPVFLGANPAAVYYGRHPVARPLGPEQDLGLALLHSMDAQARGIAVVADRAPFDIRSATTAQAQLLSPPGVAASVLAGEPRARLDDLVALYLSRLAPELARPEQARIAGGDLHFAWEGPTSPGTAHYYRIQADDLLIEYDNTTPDGNHAHSVLRRLGGDFGTDILAAHYRQAHQVPPAAGRA